MVQTEFKYDFQQSQFYIKANEDEVVFAESHNEILLSRCEIMRMILTFTEKKFLENSPLF